ncbi:hypothetical protein ACFV7Q_33990 [Streptomyces sp. NPDC059851]|uniref:hypothetical protein n=1 Tax=Streptomyces sp. NPDC059851 TaxID=3346971 RepID=UPI0036572198
MGLLQPALRGIAKHVHFPFTRPGEHLNVAVYVLLHVGVVAPLAGLALDNAARAVARTQQATEQRRAAPSHFGADPEWMCVQPTVPLAVLMPREACWIPAGRTCSSASPTRRRCCGKPGRTHR